MDLPSSLDVTISDNLLVVCSFRGRPRPSVSWQFDGRPLPSVFATEERETTDGYYYGVAVSVLTWGGSNEALRRGHSGVIRCTGDSTVMSGGPATSRAMNLTTLCEYLLDVVPGGIIPFHENNVYHHLKLKFAHNYQQQLCPSRWTI